MICMNALTEGQGAGMEAGGAECGLAGERPTWLIWMKMSLTKNPKRPTAKKPIAVSRDTLENSFRSGFSQRLTSLHPTIVALKRTNERPSDRYAEMIAATVITHCRT
jgi:hypothetical protein